MLYYYVLTLDPNVRNVFDFIRQHRLAHEVHLNRTRFSIDPHSPAYTEFALRWAHCCPPLDPTLDLVTGLPHCQVL
jgi:hypothetical protein